jgi:protein TonB
MNTRHSTTSPPASPSTTVRASAQTYLMKIPIAHEVPVTATGARPGDSGSQRKLLTEEASTVLAFENGGVMRLSAAVAVGQLLLLTNKETGREVVAQVIRKRDFRPTSCYVEVEFSEPSHGFWGIEFPEMPELAPANARQRDGAEFVHEVEAIADRPRAPVRAPSALEVTALKHEVEALRMQLKLLQTQTGAGNSSAPAVTPDAPTNVAVSAPHGSAALPIDREETSFSKEDLLPKPAVDFGEALASVKRRSKLKQRLATSRRSGALRLGLLFVTLLLVAASAAWYQHRLSWRPQPKRVSAGAASSIAARPGPMVSFAPQQAADPHSTTRASAAASQPSAASHGRAPSAPPAPGNAAAAAVQEESAAGLSATKRGVRRPSSEAPPDSATPSSEEAPIVPPKLIKSVRAIAPPDALRDFVTGNVTLDAVVDPSGRVKSMKVLSGPASFHTAAMDALKQYRYEPAIQRGKPVADHITVTIKFWFEP